MNSGLLLSIKHAGADFDFYLRTSHAPCVCAGADIGSDQWELHDQPSSSFTGMPQLAHLQQVGLGQWQLLPGPPPPRVGLGPGGGGGGVPGQFGDRGGPPGGIGPAPPGMGPDGTAPTPVRKTPEELEAERKAKVCAVV